MQISVKFDSPEEFQKFMRWPDAAPEEIPTPKANTEPDPAPEEVPTPKDKKAPVQEEKPKAVTLTDVRAKALELSKAGKKDALKKAFLKFNATKLSEIAENDYPDLMKALGEIDG